METVISKDQIATFLERVLEPNDNVIAYLVSGICERPTDESWVRFSPSPGKKFNKWLRELPSNPVKGYIG